ncbi:MAG: HigA family addiction module antitoxin [Planctomycetota bacterium]|nr:HigA family addiction module antitoxin [Planctomycetota bacterium]
MGLSQVDLARHLNTSVQRVNEVVTGKRGVTPELVWLLAGALGATPGFWINLQTQYDLARARPAKAVRPIRFVS